MIASAKPHQHPDGYRGKKREFALYLVAGSLDADASILLACPRCTKIERVRPRRNRKYDSDYFALIESVDDPYQLRFWYPGIGTGEPAESNAIMVEAIGPLPAEYAAA